MLNKLKASPGARNHRTKRVGRGFGSGIGGRSTRGTKGQLARKSGNVRLGFEGGQTPLYRRVAKIGFNNHNFKKAVAAVTLKQLNYFSDVKVFDLDKLIELGLVHSRAQYVKVIGDEPLKTAITVKVHAFSKNAAKIIVAAGGKAEVVKADQA